MQVEKRNRVVLNSSALLIFSVALCSLFLQSCETTTEEVSTYTVRNEKSQTSILDSQLTQLEKEASEYPKRHDLQYQIAGILFQKQDYKKCVKALHRAIELSPRESKYHYHMGRVYLQMGEVAEAETHFQNATACMPGDRYTGPHAALGYAMARQRRFDEAVKEFETCIRIEPENPTFYYFLGSLYDIMDEEEKVINYYSEYVARGGRRYRDNALFILGKLGVEVEVPDQDTAFPEDDILAAETSAGEDPDEDPEE